MANSDRPKNGFWTSGKRFGGVWKWDTTGQTVGYAHWGGAAPSGYNKNRIILDVNYWHRGSYRSNTLGHVRWSAVDDDEYHGIICEMPKIQN